MKLRDYLLGAGILILIGGIVLIGYGLWQRSQSTNDVSVAEVSTHDSAAACTTAKALAEGSGYTNCSCSSSHVLSCTPPTSSPPPSSAVCVPGTDTRCVNGVQQVCTNSAGTYQDTTNCCGGYVRSGGSCVQQTTRCTAGESSCIGKTPGASCGNSGSCQVQGGGSTVSCTCAGQTTTPPPTTTPPTTTPPSSGDLCGSDGRSNCTDRNVGGCSNGQQRITCYSNVNTSIGCYDRYVSCGGSNPPPTTTPPATNPPAAQSSSSSSAGAGGPTGGGDVSAGDTLPATGIFDDFPYLWIGLILIGFGFLTHSWRKQS